MLLFLDPVAAHQLVPALLEVRAREGGRLPTEPLPAGKDHGGSRAKKEPGREGAPSAPRLQWDPGATGGEGAEAVPQGRAAPRLVSEGWGMGGEQRLCWGRTKGKDKDYFKPVLITAPNRDWGWEPQLSQGGC